jgi:hypothetical protein
MPETGYHRQYPYDLTDDLTDDLNRHSFLLFAFDWVVEEPIMDGLNLMGQVIILLMV